MYFDVPMLNHEAQALCLMRHYPGMSQSPSLLGDNNARVPEIFQGSIDLSMFPRRHGRSAEQSAWWRLYGHPGTEPRRLLLRCESAHDLQRYLLQSS